MAAFLKLLVFVCILYHLDVTRAKPFGEFGFKRHIDFVYKPLPLKPIAFIKEKWGPFGVFGSKHGLVKRDLDSIVPMERVSVPIVKSETRLPAEVYEVPAKPEVPVVPPPPVVHAPIPGPPLGPVLITPPKKPQEPIDGLHTNINRDELINAYMKTIEMPIEKPVLPEEKVLAPVENSIVIEEKKNEVLLPPSLKDEPNPIVKGSRLAMYIGNILLEVLSQILKGVKPE